MGKESSLKFNVAIMSHIVTEKLRSFLPASSPQTAFMKKEEEKRLKRKEEAVVKARCLEIAERITDMKLSEGVSVHAYQLFYRRDLVGLKALEADILKTTV